MPEDTEIKTGSGQDTTEEVAQKEETEKIIKETAVEKKGNGMGWVIFLLAIIALLLFLGLF